MAEIHKKVSQLKGKSQNFSELDKETNSKLVLPQFKFSVLLQVPRSSSITVLVSSRPGCLHFPREEYFTLDLCSAGIVNRVFHINSD